MPPDAEPTPAFYALRPGGWRDYVTLLHPPYTVWHLSYVALGACAAPVVDGFRLWMSVLAFFLGVGIAAHALDELSGHPLRTRIPDPVLWALAAAGLVGALALGTVGVLRVSWWLMAFICFGAFIVVAYNLELLGGRLHSLFWFALAWGAFPALTGYFAQTGTVRVQGVLVGAACFLLSVTQRRLSTPVRRLRREILNVEGRLVTREGRHVPVDETMLMAAPEAALRTIAVGLGLLALGLSVARLS